MQKKEHFSIVFVCVILGIMLAVQFRTTRDSRAPLQYQRAEDLTQQLRKSEQERNELERLVRDLRQTAGRAVHLSQARSQDVSDRGRPPVFHGSAARHARDAGAGLGL